MVSKLRKAFPLRKISKKKNIGNVEIKNDDTGNDNKDQTAMDEEVELDLSNAIQRIKRKKKDKQIVLPEVNLDE